MSKCSSALIVPGLDSQPRLTVYQQLPNAGETMSYFFEVAMDALQTLFGSGENESNLRILDPGCQIVFRAHPNADAAFSCMLLKAGPVWTNGLSKHG